MATATAKSSKTRHSRRTWRGWMTLTDLVAAASAAWAVAGGWSETHSIGDCLLRAVLVYGTVHAVAPTVRGGKR